jgi:DNA-binding transcriptional ArsR family regulator
MKAIKTISDPEAFKIFADETRRRIVFLLRAKEMTVGQIAEELNLTPQAVYHHINKLVQGGMVEVVREVRVAHLIESYYRATAETFNLVMGKTSRSADFIKDQTVTALNALNKLGFKIEFSEETIAKLVDLQIEQSKCCDFEKYEDAISEMDDVDLMTKILVEEFAEILSMTEEELVKQDKIRKRLVELLRSLTKNRKEQITVKTKQ